VEALAETPDTVLAPGLVASLLQQDAAMRKGGWSDQQPGPRSKRSSLKLPSPPNIEKEKANYRLSVRLPQLPQLHLSSGRFEILYLIPHGIVSFLSLTFSFFTPFSLDCETQRSPNS
jgi:hypothetical protein